MHPNSHQRRAVFGNVMHALRALWAASVPDFDDTLIVDQRTGLPPGGSRQGRDADEPMPNADDISQGLVLWVSGCITFVLSVCLITGVL